MRSDAYKKKKASLQLHSNKFNFLLLLKLFISTVLEYKAVLKL